MTVERIAGLAILVILARTELYSLKAYGIDEDTGMAACGSITENFLLQDMLIRRLVDAQPDQLHA